MKLTPELITAAGLDAGNVAMRAGGRRQWNDDDYNRAGEVVAYLNVLAGRIDPEDYEACGWGKFTRRKQV
jgi:hypothetical protein